jgi:hypothetical protein
MIEAVTASEGEELRKAVAVKAAADVGNIRATFVSYAAAMTELDAMSNMTGGSMIALACGNADSNVRLVHTTRVGVVGRCRLKPSNPP